MYKPGSHMQGSRREVWIFGNHESGSQAFPAKQYSGGPFDPSRGPPLIKN